MTKSSPLDQPTVESLRIENDELKQQLRDARSRLEQTERESLKRQLFESVFRGAPDAMVLADNAGCYVDANESACELFGVPHDQLIGRAVSEFAGAAYNTHTEWNTFRRDNFMSGTFPLKRADGQLRLCDFAAVTNIAPGQHLSILRDATASHTKTKKTEELLSWIVRSSDNAIISKDLEGNITSWNRAAEELFGYSADEAIGRSIRMLIPPARSHEEDEILRRVHEGQSIRSLETVRVRKDGTEIEVEVSSAPVTDHEGRIVGVSKIARDLSAKRRSESTLRLLEEQLRHSQKMEAVGQLAGGVAHDFNNLLTVILSYTELIMSSLGESDQVRLDVEEIDHAARRAADLTRQLLAFGRRQVLQPTTLNLNDVLPGMERMLGRLIGENIELTCLMPSQVGPVHVDQGQLEQVIVNLAVNARDAMPDGGSLTLETRDVVLDVEYASTHLGVVPGPYVELAVSDTGTGMSAETRERIFEPFFTTKEQGKGTGLGLSTVFGIVKQSGGHIWVYSELGRGTTFKVYFPLARQAEVLDAAPFRIQDVLGGTERVLLVEDDPQVRKVGYSVLRRSGYTVLEASNGAEALDLVSKSTEKIDLLLTDVVMPGMTGRELADQLVARFPGLRVLYVSGYTENSIVHNGVLDRGIAFLAKPLTPQLLLRKVREVLG